MYWPRNACADPRELPELRQALLQLAQENGPWEQSEQVRAFSELAGEVTPDAVQNALDRSANALDWNRHALRNAQLMHVSAELCDILYASADTIPADTVLTEDMPPTPFGFAVFEQPFIGIDAGDKYNDVRVDGVLWGPIRFPERDDFLSSQGVLPGFGFQAFRFLDPVNHTDQPVLDTLAERPGDIPRQAMWLPLGRADWVIGDPVSRPAHNGIDPDSAQHASMVEDRRLAAALWALVQQKLVVDRTQVTATKAARKRLARAGVTADPIVEVVHLRRKEYVARHDDGSTDRRIGVRFAVRPHWRNQPYGPGRTKRKLILIPPHLKGPEGAPVKHVERVWSIDT